MVETARPNKELRYRNVSLHSQGKTEHGTLYLWKHHACFSYYPGAKKGSTSKAHSRNTSGAQGDGERDASSTPKLEGPTESKANNAHVSTQPKSEQVRGRPKDIWLPYPMIAFCQLRPSHAASITARPNATEDSAQIAQGGDELFPPTFGTSGYESMDRLSTDSARLAPISSPSRPSSPLQAPEMPGTRESARQPVIRIRRKDFQMMALHFHSGDSDLSADEIARQAFHVFRKRSCIHKVESLHAFHYQPHKDEMQVDVPYDARKEFARMGISPKAADGPGTAWRISEINHDYSYSGTYPSVLCVPKAVSDNLLKYGGVFRSKSRIPCLSYLHPNGGCITRSSQPMVGLRNKRSPQDERLVSAIFSSHTPSLESREDSPPQGQSLTPPSSAILESSVSETPDLSVGDTGLAGSQSETALNERVGEKPPTPRVYGSTRQNIVVDARPWKNVYANQLTGGGIEDVAKYVSNGHTPAEKVSLNIENIHVMRESLDKVVESFGSADYVDMRPNQETLRRSGWLGHIAGLLSGSEMVARVVGLGGSSVLVHCSDGWDRTSQVVALSQIMLDPHYRTLSGFISLVQKDFLSFGHKFRDRDGIEGSEDWFKIENERIMPSRTRENGNGDSGGLNSMGQKAFSGARRWFEKNKGNIFNQQNASRGGSDDNPGSRSSSPPPPNPIIHSPPSSTEDEDKQNTMKKNEVSPVFHQFLDTVYQLLHQQPNAFEFNERFLKRLYYHAYACQYGEFLFNNERDRTQHKLPSVWGLFLSRRQEFTNPEYVPKVDDPLLFPKRTGMEREIEVRWFAGLFGRKDEDMNLPRALVPAEPTPQTSNLRTSTLVDEPAMNEGNEVGAEKPNGAIKETRSTPSLAAMRDSLTTSFSSMTFRIPDAKKEPIQEPDAKPAQTVTSAGEQRKDQTAKEQPEIHQPEASFAPSGTAKFDQMDMVEGDPLGVSSSAPKQVGSSGLDFAAFASQNAFRDR